MNESPEIMHRLQAMIDESARTAGSGISRNFIGAGWSMSAEEFVAFWRDGRMASVATASRTGVVHAVPLDVRLIDGIFYIATFGDSQRLKDHIANPRCAINAWDGPYHAAIVYGDAHRAEDIDGRTAETAKTQGHEPWSMVTVAVTPARIYAIRPPAGHHSLQNPPAG